MSIGLVCVDGVELEARWDGPATPAGVVVFCHPHPLHQGTMTAPLMSAITGHLVEDGFAVLRFNFRGVGRSEGNHDGGGAEMDDISAAVAEAVATHPDIPMGLAGWSFGAATALCWQARERSALTYVGIAPPVQSDRTPPLPGPGDLAPTRRSFIVGDRDQFVEVDDLTAYATSIGATVEVLRGSDHFFYFREERVAEMLAAGLRPGGA